MQERCDIENQAIEKAMFYIYMIATYLLLMPALIAIGIKYTGWAYVAAGLLTSIVWNIYKYVNGEEFINVEINWSRPQGGRIGTDSYTEGTKIHHGYQ